MCRTKPEFRWATAAEVRELKGPVAQTIRAKVAVLNGRIVGFGGYYLHHGRAFMFSQVEPELQRFKVAVVKEVLDFMSRLSIPAVCIADPDIPGAERFLSRLGWQHVASGPEGEVYAWQT